MNNSTTASVTLESLRETIASLPRSPRRGVYVYAGTPQELVAEMRAAGFREIPYQPLGMGWMDGLEIVEIPLFRVTLIGPPADVGAVMADPVSLAHAVAVAGSKPRPSTPPLPSMLLGLID